MPTLQELTSQLESARDMHGVVKTMKAMAAVKIRQFQQAVEALDDYQHTIEAGLQILLHQRPAELAVQPAEGPRPMAAVVLGSDQGMVGAFNDEVAEHADHRLEELEDRVDGQLLLVVGEQAVVAVQALGRGIDRRLPAPGSADSIARIVESIVLVVEHWRSRRGVEHVWVFLNTPTSGASYQTTGRHLLPPDRAWLQRLQEEPWPTRVIPDHDMAWEPLFSSLIRNHLYVRLFRALAQSAAAENASRIASMQSAEQNIEERIEKLQAKARQQRQQDITEELLDVVAGFEALSSDR